VGGDELFYSYFLKFMDIGFAQKLIKKTQDYYGQRAQDFSASRNRDWAIFLPLLHYIKKGDYVLDLGCGNGRLYPLVAQKGANYLGLDTSHRLLEEAKKNHPQAEFEIGDILNLPPITKSSPPVRGGVGGGGSLWKFLDPSPLPLGKGRNVFKNLRNSENLEHPPGSFDVVVLIALLHHIPSHALRQKALQNVAKLVKIGGFVLVTNWNLFQKRFWPLRRCYNLKKVFGKNKMDFNDLLFKGKRYYHGFTKREMAGLLQENGFQVLENYYEKDGRRTRRGEGENLVTVAEKM